MNLVNKDLETSAHVCKRCQGKGEKTTDGFTAVDGTVYPSRTYPCRNCMGTGQFPELDEQKIRELIIATRGKNKGKLKSAYPSPYNPTHANETRAYYVWRMARFHGGVDVTMPMTASMLIDGDPLVKELDKIADTIAKESFGTDMAATRRWMRALTGM